MCKIPEFKLFDNHVFRGISYAKAWSFSFSSPRLDNFISRPRHDSFSFSLNKKPRPSKMEEEEVPPGREDRGRKKNWQRLSHR